jgi:hypothetical protein
MRHELARIFTKRLTILLRYGFRLRPTSPDKTEDKQMGTDEGMLGRKNAQKAQRTEFLTGTRTFNAQHLTSRSAARKRDTNLTNFHETFKPQMSTDGHR